MAKILSSSVIQRAVAGLFLDQNDKIPSETLDKVQLTYDLNPNFANVVSSSNTTITGDITIYTTPTARDFYLQSIIASYVKDATCDLSTGGNIIVSGTAGGISRRFVVFPVITLTAQSQMVSIVFPKPIKLDKGTTIIMSGGFSVGVLVKSCQITGFEDSSN